jgi:branched-chain amino acid aminotransferase
MIKYAYVKNRFVNRNNAKVSIKERGFRFGDGIFETIRIRNYKLTDFDLHLKRLEAGLKAIKISFNLLQIAALAQKLIGKNQQKEGFVRISISRGIGSKGYLPVNCKATLIIETENLRRNYIQDYKLIISPYQKISGNSLPVNYKLMQGINSTLSALYAKEHNVNDAILLNHDNYISETSSANIFMVKDGAIFTPPLIDDLLGGVVREKVIANFSITEQSFKLDDLSIYDNIFISNVAIKLKLITKIIKPNNQILWCNKLNDQSLKIINKIKIFLN